MGKWRNLEGEQAEIATDYLSQTQSHAVTDTETDSHTHSDTAESSRLDCDMPIPVCAGFHQTCYSRFTDKQRADRVIARMKKRQQFAVCGK